MNVADEGFGMESTGPNGSALFGAMGVIDWILQSISRMGARFPIETTSVMIGMALMAGLKHPIRRRIYDHLVRLPGDHFRSVARSLNLAVGTARYHLNALAREGLVYKQDTNGRARYYVTGGEAEVNRLYARHWEYRDVRLRILGLRSEEHTSELQSQSNLVCRLLLEKKKHSAN